MSDLAGTSRPKLRPGCRLREPAGESDMLLIPDPNTHTLDPFTEAPTLVMICDVIDPVTNPMGLRSNWCGPAFVGTLSYEFSPGK